MTTRTITEHGRTWPATWTICSRCQGDGHVDAWDGGLTASEFNELFDTPEDRDDYAAGAYARRCPERHCHGGKALELDRDQLTAAEIAEYDQAAAEIAEMYAIQAAEIRAGC